MASSKFGDQLCTGRVRIRPLMFRHVLYDLWTDDSEKLERVPFLQQVMLEAVRRSRAVILHSHFHQFDPHGVTGVVLISQSHLTIHTWSENHYAAIDFFTYSDLDVDATLGYIREQLHPVRERVTDLVRGQDKTTGFDMPRPNV